MTRKEPTKRITRSPEVDATGFSKVFAFLRDQLLAGRLRSGDRLIPERDLAAQLGVSRPILREALRGLAMIGVVEIRSRVGTVVRQPDVSVLSDFFAFSLAQQGDLIDDVMQARIAIECQAIRLACTRAATADFERLRAALGRVEETIDDPTLGAEADFQFHAALVRAARSETLSGLYAAMSTLLMRSHRDRRFLVEADPAIKQYLLDDHRRVFEALVAADEERAEQVLRQHFSIGDNYRRDAATRVAGVTPG